MAWMVWGLNPDGVRFSTSSRPALGFNLPSVQWVPEGRWLGHGIDHATPQPMPRLKKE